MGQGGGGVFSMIGSAWGMGRLEKEAISSGVGRDSGSSGFADGAGVGAVAGAAGFFQTWAKCLFL